MDKKMVPTSDIGGGVHAGVVLSLAGPARSLAHRAVESVLFLGGDSPSRNGAAGYRRGGLGGGCNGEIETYTGTFGSSAH
jgi:hypothetical protein